MASELGWASLSERPDGSAASDVTSRGVSRCWDRSVASDIDRSCDRRISSFAARTARRLFAAIGRERQGSRLQVGRLQQDIDDAKGISGLSRDY